MLEKSFKDLEIAMHALDAAGIEPSQELMTSFEKVKTEGCTKANLTAFAKAVDREYTLVLFNAPFGAPEKDLWFDASAAANALAFFYPN